MSVGWPGGRMVWGGGCERRGSERDEFRDYKFAVGEVMSVRAVQGGAADLGVR